MNRYIQMQIFIKRRFEYFSNEWQMNLVGENFLLLFRLSDI